MRRLKRDLPMIVGVLAALATIASVLWVVRDSELKDSADRARITTVVEGLQDNQKRLIVAVDKLVTMDGRTTALEDRADDLEAEVDKLQSCVSDLQQRVSALEGAASGRTGR